MSMYSENGKLKRTIGLDTAEKVVVGDSRFSILPVYGAFVSND